VSGPDTNVIRLNVAGEQFVVDLFGLTGDQWRDIRRVTDLRPAQFTALVVTGDIEAIAAVVWLSKREELEVTYDSVLAALTIGDLGVGPEPEPDSDAA
jgi:hypothetical protein